MPKVTEEYRSAKRHEIADAALRAFRAKGFQGASMADIIAESGLSAGAIYGHFTSKSDIVLDVATRVVGSRLDDVARVTASDPMPAPSHLLRVIVRGILDDLGDPKILVQVWGEAVTEPKIRELATTVFERLCRVYATYISQWHQREHGLDAATADALGDEQVGLFVGAAQGYIVQSALMPDFDGEHYLTTLDKYLPR